MDNTKRRPGDLILDRYLSDADEETRERAREALRRFAMLLVRIGERIETEQSTAPAAQKIDRRHNSTTPEYGSISN